MPQERYGLDREIQEKLEAKYDAADEAKALEWIEELTGCEPISRSDPHKDLKNGVILCTLLNCIRPGTVQKFVKNPNHVLTERENIQAYLNGCVALHLPSQDLFIISDLHEAKSMYAVFKNIYALGRQAQVIPTYNGPKLGVTYTVTVEEQERRQQQKAEAAAVEIERLREMDIQQTLRRKHLEEEKKHATLKKRAMEEERVKKRQINRTIKGSKIKQTASDLRYERQEAKDQMQRSNSINISPVRYGMDLEIEKKMEDKYDYAAEEEAMDWIELVTEIGVDDFYEDLKSGVVLCELINKIQPGMIIKINRKAIPLMHRENIQFYLNACMALGVPSSNLFIVSDLYERKDLAAVVSNIHALARATEYRKSFTGPRMGKQKPMRVRQPSLRSISGRPQSYGSITRTQEITDAAAMQSSCCACTIL